MPELPEVTSIVNYLSKEISEKRLQVEGIVFERFFHKKSKIISFADFFQNDERELKGIKKGFSKNIEPQLKGIGVQRKKKDSILFPLPSLDAKRKRGKGGKEEKERKQDKVEKQDKVGGGNRERKSKEKTNQQNIEENQNERKSQKDQHEITLEEKGKLFAKNHSWGQPHSFLELGKFIVVIFERKSSNKWNEKIKKKIASRNGLTTEASETSASMLIHLRMSGAFVDGERLPNPKKEHCHFFLMMKDFKKASSKISAKGKGKVSAKMKGTSRCFFFIDPRTFATVQCYFSIENMIADLQYKNIGIDATEKSEHIRKRLMECHSSRKSIKAILLDQTIVAGIGNIYASECLFLAKINPQLTGGELVEQDWKNLASCIPNVMKKAIASGGVTIEKKGGYQLPDGSRGHYANRAYVYGLAEEMCKICKGKIKKIVQEGRATYFCPYCQTRG